MTGEGLSGFQVAVSQLFFELEESAGYIVTGGAALLASDLITRPTQDLDLFAGVPIVSVVAAKEALIAALCKRGWNATLVHDDLMSVACWSRESKMLALFGRAEVRDFAGVFRLAERFGKEALLAEASAADPGFDLVVLAQMMGSLDRFDDDEFPMAPEDVPVVRTFFRIGPANFADEGDHPGDPRAEQFTAHRIHAGYIGRGRPHLSGTGGRNTCAAPVEPIPVPHTRVWARKGVSRTGPAPDEPSYVSHPPPQGLPSG